MGSPIGKLSVNNLNNYLRRFTHKLNVVLNFNQEKQIEYLLELSTWMSDGVKPIDALRGMNQIFLLSGKAASIQNKATESMIDALSSGKPMYVGMQSYFTKYLVTIFRSAEETGTMGEALSLLSEDDKQIKELKTIYFKPVIPAFFYVLLMLASSINITTDVLPSLARGKPFDEWPLPAQNYTNLINSVIDYWPFILTAIIAGLLLLTRMLANNTSSLRMDLDTMPILNAYRTFVANQYLKMLSVLMLANIKPMDALKLMEANGTPYVAWHAKEAQKKLDMGEMEIGKAIDTGLIADEVLIKMQYLTSVSSHEGKVKGLRVTASRSIGLAMKSLKRAGLITSLGLFLILLYLLMNAAMAIITLSVAK
ncbi:hypothetical protein GCM10011607_28650 [Shewanella inventionis]|uniref:Type II secretion system protein GspF domain-containing protein n=1 Tax=Shewanella inventionis TaxID=1738770 RepID=A0ABQ1JDL1_9GAMM|nr:hypothetical protein [Shewanella inventionis]GGB66255.1 hypothetical protein GCM10011607_28650 [Shewanella inventionis]